MKKLSFLMTIVLCVSMGMAITPSKGYAVLSALTETGMREATAQAGIAITAADQIALNMEIGSMVYGDSDGTDGTAGYLSVNDVSFQGVINLQEPVSISVTTEQDLFSHTMMTGINVSLNGATIDVDHFDIGSITVGTEPGEGNSFGSISIRDYHAQISGNVRITTN
ncbi:MAG: hypothetical protein KKD44_20230 [Proteobacteria bacterium]|nr:hypothetical protein [Pseudomonadota bacterium]